MGYTTDFSGSFEVTPPMKKELVQFIQNFSETRRMSRNQPENFGIQGEFYLPDTENFGQRDTEDVIDYNRPPSTQPGLWCQWTATDESTIEWDGGEKFYEYVDWLVYIIEKILKPNGHTLNGEVMWQGEEMGDSGKIMVNDGVVGTVEAFSSHIRLHEASDKVRVDVPFILKETEDKKQEETLDFWKNNATEDYINTPISVLKYISKLEEELQMN